MTQMRGTMPSAYTNVKAHPKPKAPMPKKSGGKRGC
jgi:hypothetical protein